MSTAPTRQMLGSNCHKCSSVQRSWFQCLSEARRLTRGQDSLLSVKGDVWIQARVMKFGRPREMICISEISKELLSHQGSFKAHMG